MAFALWGLAGLLVATGWMLGLDRFWGDETLQAVHAGLAYTLVGLVAVHAAAAVAVGRAQRSNLIKAMLTGRTSIPG